MRQKPSAVTLRFLEKASLLYRETCPEQSRFLMLRHQASGEALPEAALCPFCCQWRQPDGQRVRLRPKRRPSPRLHRLLQREAAGRRLRLRDVELLRRFRSSSNTLMATCHACNKTSRLSGANRDFLAPLPKSHGTPGSSGKRRPHQPAGRGGTATPRSSPSERTPTGTPRSTSSENIGCLSSKSGSTKKSPFSRLKRLLMLDDSQKSKKGGLKDFLSSL